jgi:hypothetical protein
MVQLRWFVGTQGFWMFLMAAGEVLSFLTVVGFMVRPGIQIQQQNRPNSSPMQAFRHRVTASMMSDASTLSQPPMPIPPIVLYRKMILRIGKSP